ncbi:MAG: RNA 2',3'-cyclic phosphodiesterase [Cloacibacillus sp.]
MRTFICVKLPQSRIESLAGSIRALRGACSDIRWVKPETIHVTLKFCGELPKETVAAITAELGRARLGAPFELSAEGIGGFPNLKAPRVLWTALRNETEALRALQKTVDGCAFRCGIEKEKSFSPHITLGRRAERGPLALDCAAALIKTNISAAPWRVSEIIFMKSELTPSGPIYTPLEIFPLK